MNRMNHAVDIYFDKTTQWQQALRQLRTIILDCQLTEELKWRAPCYTSQDHNIVIIQHFKDYCALLFFKGSLLKDVNGILVKPGQNTQAGRQIRFTDVRQVVEMEAVLKAYISEAVEVERSGLKVQLRDTSEFDIPAEFQTKLDESAALKTAFDALTPGRQRAYLLHFSTPKQSKTRESRVERSMQRILNGRGLNN